MITSFLLRFDQNSEGCSWLKFNNQELALAIALKFYISATKGFRLKFRKFWELIPTFVEATIEKLEDGVVLHPLPSRIALTFVSTCCGSNFFVTLANQLKDTC